MKVKSSLDLTTIVQMYQYCACSAYAPSLLTSHLPADWHPLKYLWGVRSLLRQSQVEQLLSGLENRMDQLSLCSLRQALWNLLSWPLSGGMSLEAAHVSRELPHCGHSPTPFWSSQLSSLHHHQAQFLNFPIYPKKTVSRQQNSKLLCPHLNHICPH